MYKRQESYKIRDVIDNWEAIETSVQSKNDKVTELNCDTIENVIQQNVQYSVIESCTSRTEITMDTIIIQTTNANEMIDPVSYTHLDVYKRQG